MAGQSKVEICNIALAMLGADAIRAFDENNKRARMADVFFDSTRDYLLTKFDWPFARKFTELKALDPSTLEVPQGLTAYQLPNDCLNPRDVYPPGSRDCWYVMGERVFLRGSAGADKRYLYYTSQAVDPTKYSKTFVNLLALGMALKMAPAITQDKQLIKQLMEQFMFEQNNAWESDANIGNTYREYDENPNNDTFVNADGYLVDPALEDWLYRR